MATLATEVNQNDRFLINEQVTYHFIFPHILSLVIIFFPYKEYRQILSAENLITTGNVKNTCFWLIL